MMEDENKVSLEETLANAILDKIESLNQFEAGSKESSAIVKDVAVMYAELTKSTEAGLKVEEANARFDLEAKKFEEEMQLKREQFEFEKQKAEEEKKVNKKIRVADWIFRGLGLAGAAFGLAIKLGFFDGWLKEGFMFEEHGSITSTTHRNNWNQLFKLLNVDK